jgi:hypothetical protein
MMGLDHTASGPAIVAPASTKASSAKPAARPAVSSTTTLKPSALSRATESGVAATRRSPGKLSFGMPKFIKPS